MVTYVNCSHGTRSHRAAERCAQLDEALKGIPEFQGGRGRHKCPYCAYEQGWNDAIKEMREKIPALLEWA